MNKAYKKFIVTMVVLTGLALFIAAGAAHRGDGMAVVVMLVIAAIFWGKVQKRS
jgi:hypothetical protein